ncbi:hypothetical protein NDU88_006244 [Pleurodeles waltl]|uniref:Uncharacterized protein n=1 Tax=Pleurodeles waltl TaxID=8319 RepID=A0AAV7NR89_PLEWA|nr:hypothetical protein NDU88_006244 [Pleurodeles waltl]
MSRSKRYASCRLKTAPTRAQGKTERAKVVPELQHMCNILLSMKWAELAQTYADQDNSSLESGTSEELKKGTSANPNDR